MPYIRHCSPPRTSSLCLHEHVTRASRRDLSHTRDFRAIVTRSASSGGWREPAGWLIVRYAGEARREARPVDQSTSRPVIARRPVVACTFPAVSSMRVLRPRRSLDPASIDFARLGQHRYRGTSLKRKRVHEIQVRFISIEIASYLC